MLFHIQDGRVLFNRMIFLDPGITLPLKAVRNDIAFEGYPGIEHMNMGRLPVMVRHN